MVDMARDGSEGSGLCYQICTRALSRGTNSILELNELHFSKQGCFVFLIASCKLCFPYVRNRRVLVTQQVVHV
jgi:hypothetical protein